MPARVFQYASFGGGQVVFEYELNDANWRVSKVRCINNSSYAARASVLENGVETFAASCPAGQTLERNVPGWTLGWDAVEGGLILGPYEFQARWPE